ncbi:hypothetical protein K0M31_007322, partial [Melipona bicolor]
NILVGFAHVSPKTKISSEQAVVSSVRHCLRETRERAAVETAEEGRSTLVKAESATNCVAGLYRAVWHAHNTPDSRSDHGSEETNSRQSDERTPPVPQRQRGGGNEAMARQRRRQDVQPIAGGPPL